MGQEHKEFTWNLIAKKLTGEATPAELRELERLLRNNPELHYPMQTISDLWAGSNVPDKEAAELAFNRHLDRIKELKLEYEPGKSTGEYYPALKKETKSIGRAIILTSLLGALLLAGWFYLGKHSSGAAPTANVAAPAGNEIHTINGSRTHLTLPDGTRVWLNAGSRLTYEKNYGETLREVNLTGEAFFDVAKNAEKPFLIHAAKIDIKVLGTSFNIKSYPSDKTTEATLLRGSIEVSIKARPSEKIILKPNEKLVVANDDSTLHRATAPRYAVAEKDEPLVTIRKPTYEQNTGANIETSWVDNKLIFREETFNDLARQMERWYSVTIRFADPSLQEMKFTGSFKEETIQQALDAMRLTAKFSYKIEGNQVTINNTNM